MNCQDKHSDAPYRVFFPELEALRGVAAFTVLILHCFHTALFSFAGVNGPKQLAELGFPSFAFGVIGETIFSGRSAVLLFFALSGFVMGVNLDTTKPLTLRNYTTFLIRRFFRLIPPVWVAVLSSLLLSLAMGGLIYEPKTQALINTSFGWNQILDFFILRDISIDSPLWSLVLEIAACLVYLPLLYFSRSLSPALQVIGIYFIFVLQVDHTVIVGWGNTAFGFPLLLFYLGIVAPSVGRSMVELLPPALASAIAAVAYILIVSPEILGALVQFDWGTSTNSALNKVYSAKTLFVPLAIFYFLSWVAYGRAGAIRRVLNADWTTFLGRISYSVYILHMQIILTMFVFVKAYSPVKHPVFHTLLLICLSVPLTLMAAAACRSTVELRSIVLGHRVLAWLGLAKQSSKTARNRARETIFFRRSRTSEKPRHEATG
jgi:peptidoglycan/LPS O-acetylase OafA/YrhL